MEMTKHECRGAEHRTSYLAAGPEDGPLIVCVHGWPELSLSWRHQLPCLAGLGFRVIAPDMRGYGGSTVYTRHEDYAQERIVADMLELLQHLGRDEAIWVGHDWGSPVVWNLASHHPSRCRAVASLCVPYYTIERGLEHVIGLVNREIYPEDLYPAGQWEYMRFYEEHFERSVREMQADVSATVKLLFRKGVPSGFGKPSGTASVRAEAGWFGGLGRAPDLPPDVDVVSDADLAVYVEALGRNGFFGPNSWYMNHERNRLYGERALNEGYLDMPCLFIHARYDYTCETITSRLAEPMHQYCRRLTTCIIDSGHWMAQEKPHQVNAALAGWLATSVGLPGPALVAVQKPVVG